MKHGFLALLGVLALSVASVQANDVNNNIVLSGGTNYFGALHTDGADFTDVFNFNMDGQQVKVSGSLFTFGAGTQNIDFVSAEINGQPLILSGVGLNETGTTGGDLMVTGPILLTVKGKSGAAGGSFAAYSGTINVMAVPEPSTCLFALSAIGAGLVAIRRKR